MFKCKDCGSEFTKWVGKCNCGSWNSLEEEKADLNFKNLTLLESEDSIGEEVITNLEEFDRVAHLHTKSVFLIGGEPGIGKSTLTCQICKDVKALYLAGEESVYSVKKRFQRVSPNSNVKIVPFFFIEELEELVKKYKPVIVILDSIYTTQSKTSNLKDIVFTFCFLSRKYNFCSILISHITKEGIISGPKSLEHMVDCVIYLEGNRYDSFRTVRAIKNRFGSTGEVGIFEIKEDGLKEFKHTSLLSSKLLSGNILFCAISGNRPMIIEVQALVTESQYPQIETGGLELKRTRIIIAILEKRCGLKLKFQDIFVKTTCDIKINDSSVDLALAIAIVSSFKNKPVEGVFWGELGLNGDIRKSNNSSIRLKECKKFNINNVYNGDYWVDLKPLLKHLDLI